MVWPLTCASLFAQANTGTIVGTVRDSSGAVLASAPIKIRNEETNISRTVVTVTQSLLVHEAMLRYTSQSISALEQRVAALEQERKSP